MNPLVLVVDDEPDVEVLFRQQFRRVGDALECHGGGLSKLHMITAYGDADTKRQAVERGAEALLTKPIDFGTLRSEIDMRIERA
jgi:CheY-like chemotaxis protein